MRIQCPKCGREAAIEAAEPGFIIQCSHCRQKLRIPKRTAQSPPSSEPEDELRLKPAESDAVPWHQPIGKKKKTREPGPDDRLHEELPRSSPDRDRQKRGHSDANGPVDSSNRRKVERRALQELAKNAHQKAEPEPSPKENQKQAQSFKRAPIAIAVAGIGIVFILTAVGWSIYRSGTSNTTYKPNGTAPSQSEPAGAPATQQGRTAPPIDSGER
jgi:hypothetical protein